MNELVQSLHQRKEQNIKTSWQTGIAAHYVIKKLLKGRSEIYLSLCSSCILEATLSCIPGSRNIFTLSNKHIEKIKSPQSLPFSMKNQNVYGMDQVPCMGKLRWKFTRAVTSLKYLESIREKSI